MKKFLPYVLMFLFALTACSAPTPTLTATPKPTKASTSTATTAATKTIPPTIETPTPEPPTATLIPPTAIPTKPVSFMGGATHLVSYAEDIYPTGSRFMGTLIYLTHHETPLPTVFLVYPGFFLHLHHGGRMDYIQDSFSADLDINRVADYSYQLYSSGERHAKAVFWFFVGPDNMTPPGWTNTHSIPEDPTIWWEVIWTGTAKTPEP